MTLLVISPDYASHLLPLATLATAWRDRGERVVVASGPATAGIVDAFGLERRELRLGRGSNPGVIRAEDQPVDEGASLRGFFAATREGAVPTLRYQAAERLTDLMWEPVQSARATQRIVEEVRPDEVLVDHLAFNARLGLATAGVPYGDVVLGHPSALPVGDEVYGLPPEWPSAVRPDPDELADLRALCERVSNRFADEWNRAARELDPAFPTTADAFAEHGPLVLYNSPSELADPARGPLLPPHRFLGSALREEPEDREIADWSETAGRFVYVSFGSFLSVRADVLRRVADALRSLGLRAAIATGSADPGELGELPGDWLVRPYLPQVRLLRAASAAVTHGGNNSVTEALGCGVPLVVLPFSTDQFAGAAAIERSGMGVALDPNAAAAGDLADALARVLDLDREARDRLDALAARQAARPGPEVAFEALAEQPEAAERAS
ncbi:nucleotide disphospho-sugar-binding domain-containing protein [Agromyces aurantiacus]|uniref:Nucleotide disphospho-sugar-binding domain-containing protein n=1 Tax=Agromyces aurantiacus TaxID=165814 RepID=A0ABV9R577_9MICO|nr:glycosyltransferase [Agromyces aurantiacus]MBM7503177.1 UDP:flavonoid glycosyltransferase YjiC (YdhE family) [Agromyces aurantiacus]